MEEKKAFEPIFSFTLILLISKYSFSFDGCASFVFWFWRDEEERRKGLTLQELWWKSIVLSGRQSSNGSPQVFPWLW